MYVSIISQMFNCWQLPRHCSKWFGCGACCPHKALVTSKRFVALSQEAVTGHLRTQECARAENVWRCPMCKGNRSTPRLPDPVWLTAPLPHLCPREQIPGSHPPRGCSHINWGQLHILNAFCFDIMEKIEGIYVDVGTKMAEGLMGTCCARCE